MPIPKTGFVTKKVLACEMQKDHKKKSQQVGSTKNEYSIGLIIFSHFVNHNFFCVALTSTLPFGFKLDRINSCFRFIQKESLLLI